MKDEEKSLPELIFDNIVKTYQPPRCKVCGKAFPRLDQEIGICNKCQKNKDKWLK